MTRSPLTQPASVHRSNVSGTIGSQTPARYASDSRSAGKAGRIFIEDSKQSCMGDTVPQPALELLESIIDNVDEDDDIDVEELQDVVADLEEEKKYATATYSMYCTGNDVLVIYNKEKDEFVELDVPMEGDTSVTVKRSN